MAVLECHDDVSAEMVSWQQGYNGMYYDQRKRGNQGLNDLDLSMGVIKCLMLPLGSPHLLHLISNTSFSTLTLLKNS